MPRTKFIRNSKSTVVKIERSLELEKKKQSVSDVWLVIEKEYKNKLLELKNSYSSAAYEIDTIAYGELSLVDPETANKTLGELRNEKSMTYSSILLSDTTASILKHSRNTTTARKKKQTDDEGYLTAGETTRSASGDRGRKRSTVKGGAANATRRVSRSLSRSKLPKNVTIQAPVKKTPEKRMVPPNSFAFVTPKMKPNTPLAMLRRPKLGEMAISMQGSPLLVSGVISETCANVNIPLTDGRILSLQPNRGLRMSQIPDLDDATRDQLLMLRDNLTKVVKMANNTAV